MEYLHRHNQDENCHRVITPEVAIPYVIKVIAKALGKTIINYSERKEVSQEDAPGVLLERRKKGKFFPLRYSVYEIDATKHAIHKSLILEAVYYNHKSHNLALIIKDPSLQEVWQAKGLDEKIEKELLDFAPASFFNNC